MLRPLIIDWNSMEYLIFGVANLVIIAIYLAMLALPAFIAYWIGTKTPIYSLRWFFPMVVIAIPCAWAAASYAVFKRDCASVSKPTFLSSPTAKPDGVSVDGRHLVGTLMDGGEFKFVEEPHGSKEIRRNIAGSRPEWVPLASSDTAFVATELAPQRVAYWWAPPIYRYEIQVTEKSSGRLLAKATDLVFGGGFLSMYMAKIGGDQDYENLSCGYASPDIGPWRPTLTSPPYFGHYIKADSDFVRKALSPTNQQQADK